MAQPRRQLDRIDLSAGAEKLSLFAGLTAGLAYSTFASFSQTRSLPSRDISSKRILSALASGHYLESSTSMAPFRQFLRR